MIVRAVLLLLSLLASCPAAEGIATPLERERLIESTREAVWQSVVNTVRNSDVLVQSIDPASHFISFLFAAPAAALRANILEADTTPASTQIVHVTAWCREATAGATRVFVRAAPGSGGMFLHSNGKLESEFLDAVVRGAQWRPGRPPYAAPVLAAGGRFDIAATRERMAQAGCAHHASQSNPAVITCAMPIGSRVLAEYTSSKIASRHAGQAYATLWFHDDGRVALRTLLFEKGAFAGAPLESTGVFEKHLLAAATPGADVPAPPPVGTVEPGRDFLTEVFAPPPDPAQRREAAASREFSISADQAWEAALVVLSQLAIVSYCDRQRGLIVAVAAHPTESDAKFSIHRTELQIAGRPLGMVMSLEAAGNSDTTNELELEYAALLERVFTQVFLREKLKWLGKS